MKEIDLDFCQKVSVLSVSSVVTKATADLAAYKKSACAMQRTWHDALVLIAAWLQVW